MEPQQQRPRRSSSVAFAALARLFAGVFFYIVWRWEGFPWRLWTLLSAVDVKVAAQILLECCPKLFDECAKAWLNRFDTIDKLSGDEPLLALFVVGILKRLTMSRIEARHSWIRRFLLA